MRHSTKSARGPQTSHTASGGERITVRHPTGVGWFDPCHARCLGRSVTWDGQQESLYLLPTGVWVLYWCWPGDDWRDREGAPVPAPEWARVVAEDEAVSWLQRHAPRALEEFRG